MNDQNYIELKWIITVIRRWWWLIAAFTIVGSAAGYFVTSIIPPVYESSTLLLVNPSKTSSESTYNNLMAGTQLALTYSQMLTDRPVLDTVIAQLGLKETTDDLLKHITAEPVHSSQIIKLTVSDTKPDRAALIANTLAQAFSKRVEELSTQQYAGAFKNVNDRLTDLQTQMKDTQAQIDTIRSQKVTKDVDLANKQTSLTTLLSDYRTYQNNYQTMQLSVAAVTGKVYIVEAVQVQKNARAATNTATIVVSVGQVQPISGSNLPGDPLAYGQLMIKTPLLQGVIKELGLSETPDELARKIGFTVVPGTQLIQFTVEDADATRAQLIAQSMVNAFITQVKEMMGAPFSDQLASLQKQIDGKKTAIDSAQTDIGKLTSDIAQMAADLDRLNTDLTSIRNDYRASQAVYDQLQTTASQTANAVVITEPAQASKTSTQNRTLYIVLAGFLGLALGVGLAFVLRYFDNMIRTDQDVRSALKLPVLSSIGQFTAKDKGLVMWSSPFSSSAEDFRVLGNKVRLFCENNYIKSILITSPVPTEGKSTIVSNLGIVLTRMGMRVVVVDADLHLPRVHKLFGLKQNEGLAISLATGNVNGSLQSTGLEELKVLTSGGVPANPAELLSSPNLEKLIQELKLKTDLILIDCPPVLSASDASIVASKVDGVLLVLRAGFSEISAAREAEEALRQVKANLIGIVLNSARIRKRGYYYKA